MDNKIPLIRASGISQTFILGDEKIPVLSKGDLAIGQGSFTIIFGPSGSGKSTLLNILSGIQEPTTGKILFNNTDVYHYTPNELAYFRANQIGVVYQQNYWINSLSVIENVSVPLFFLGYTRPEARVMAMNALQRVDMATFADKNPVLLSGGEQQRIGLARAIVNEPNAIIADEPTGSLDSKNGDMIMSLLQSYCRDLKRTVILVTHNMEYLPLADHLIHIQDGECQEVPNDQILPTTEKLLDEIRLRLTKKRDKAHHANNSR